MRVEGSEETMKYYTKANFKWLVEAIPVNQLRMLICIVELPSKALETIINTTQIQEKIDYILNAYDDNMHLKANPDIRIVGGVVI